MPAIDNIDEHRERLASVLGLDVGELFNSRRADPEAVLLRMIGAYALHQDQLPIAEISRVLNQNQAWVRYAIDYVERRMSRYYAFQIRVDKMMDEYAGPGVVVGKEAATINGYRERISAAVGMEAGDLVALVAINPDAETMQRTAAFVLLSRDRLPIGEVARVLNKSDEWVRSSTHYIESQVKRHQEVRSYVEKATESYAASRASAKPEARSGAVAKPEARS